MLYAMVKQNIVKQSSDLINNLQHTSEFGRYLFPSGTFCVKFRVPCGLRSSLHNVARTLEKFENHSTTARSLKTFFVFSQHSAWVITLVN